MNNLHNTLIQFGLSPKEVTVYLALLENNASLVNDISKKTKLNRSTTYVILNSLLEKGMVSIAEDSVIKHYSATTPDRIVESLENNAKKYIELTKMAKNIMPDLKALYKSTGDKPKLRFFEGLEGIKSALEETINSKETIKTYMNVKNMKEIFSHHLPESYCQRRVAKNIKMEAIFTDSNDSREQTKYNKKELREAYCVPYKEFPFPSEIMIHDNRIVFISLTEKFAFIVESEEIANAMKAIFKLSWSEAKRQHKKLKI